MNKKGKKRLGKGQRHQLTDLLKRITVAVETVESRNVRLDLMETAYRSGATDRDFTNATLEGIRKPFKRERG